MNATALYSSVSAGSPLPIDDGRVFDLANHLISHPLSTFCVRVSGDSMKDAGIFDGDIVIVDRSLTPRPSDIVLAQVGDGFTVKRFEHSSAGLRLVPANPDFKPKPTPEETQICGVATFCIHPL